jgi:hypothetical protein
MTQTKFQPQSRGLKINFSVSLFKVFLQLNVNFIRQFCYQFDFNTTVNRQTSICNLESDNYF